MNIDNLKDIKKSNPWIRVIIFPIIYIRRYFNHKESVVKNRIINNFAEMITEDPIVRVKEFNGSFAMDVHSDLFSRLILLQEYESKLVKISLKYLDTTRDVIDVGANIGFFTILFSKLLKSSKVLSIEPTKYALRRLHKNIALNDQANKVIVFEGVVSDKKGKVEIKTVKGKEEYSSLGEMAHPSIANSKYNVEKVASCTIDELTERYKLNPGFIKIDVEGVEHLVLLGAKKTMATNRPIIMTELSNYLLKCNGSSSIEVINTIKQYDYHIYDPVEPEVEPGTKDFGDIICIPKELI